MADNSFASDYIRNFPSSLPIRSPSPDTKASNKLNRTISPTIELRNQPQSSPQSVKGSRRINTEYETLRSENYELREQLASAQMGGGTFSNDEITRLRQRIKEQDRMILSYKRETDKIADLGSSFLKESRGQTAEELRQRLQEKDRVINELKKILTAISGTSSSAVYHSHNQASPISEEYRQKIKVLELENERLTEIVKKLNRRDSSQKLLQENKMLSGRVEELLIENNELEQKIERLRRSQTEEMVELTKINAALSGQLKLFSSLEEKNRSLERENERLMRLLKDSQKGTVNRSLEEEITRLQQENRSIRERASAGPEKLSIGKIKEQYNENIKIFKQTVYEEVSREFEKFESTIKELHSKLDLLEQRTNRMEHTGRISTSPGREVSPPAGKMHRSLQQEDYESPDDRRTKKKTTAGPTGQRLFDQTQHVEVRSEIAEDSEIFRLETDLKIQVRQKTELSEKYNQLTADYNSLNQTHVASLQDIQRYLLEIKRLKQTLEEAQQQATHQLTIIEEVTHLKVDVERQHQEEVTRVRQNSATQADRIRLNYEEKLEQLRTMTQDQINRLNDTYNQEIVVLRQNIEEKTRQVVELEKLVKAREIKLQQELTEKQTQINRLQREIDDREHRLAHQQTITKDYEEKVETRTRSYTLLESNYKSLKERNSELSAELESIMAECSELRKDKEEAQAEHRRASDSLREANMLALSQMRDEHERNKQLAEQNARLEERVRELFSGNQSLHDNLATIRIELHQTKASCNNQQQVRQLKLDEIIRQAEEVKAVLSHPEASAVIDQLLKALSVYRSQKESFSVRLSALSKESQTAALRHRAELLALEKQNKLLQLRLQTVQKELEIRLAESEALRTLLDDRVRSSEGHSHLLVETSSSSEHTEIDTSQLQTVQSHYVDGLRKLQYLIQDLEAIRSFQPTH